jgi:hypothetical protein
MRDHPYHGVEDRLSLSVWPISTLTLETSKDIVCGGCTFICPPPVMNRTHYAQDESNERHRQPPEGEGGPQTPLQEHLTKILSPSDFVRLTLVPDNAHRPPPVTAAAASVAVADTFQSSCPLANTSEQFGRMMALAMAPPARPGRPLFRSSSDGMDYSNGSAGNAPGPHRNRDGCAKYLTLYQQLHYMHEPKASRADSRWTPEAHHHHPSCRSPPTSLSPPPPSSSIRASSSRGEKGKGRRPESSGSNKGKGKKAGERSPPPPPPHKSGAGSAGASPPPPPPGGGILRPGHGGARRSRPWTTNSHPQTRQLPAPIRFSSPPPSPAPQQPSPRTGRRDVNPDMNDASESSESSGSCKSNTDFTAPPLSTPTNGAVPDERSGTLSIEPLASMFSLDGDDLSLPSPRWAPPPGARHAPMVRWEDGIDGNSDLGNGKTSGGSWRKSNNTHSGYHFQASHYQGNSGNNIISNSIDVVPLSSSSSACSSSSSSLSDRLPAGAFELSQSFSNPSQSSPSVLPYRRRASRRGRAPPGGDGGAGGAGRRPRTRAALYPDGPPPPPPSPPSSPSSFRGRSALRRQCSDSVLVIPQRSPSNDSLQRKEAEGRQEGPVQTYPPPMSPASPSSSSSGYGSASSSEDGSGKITRPKNTNLESNARQDSDYK